MLGLRLCKIHVPSKKLDLKPLLRDSELNMKCNIAYRKGTTPSVPQYIICPILYFILQYQ